MTALTAVRRWDPTPAKNLSTFGIITAVHTLATVLFSAALAVIIARAAHGVCCGRRRTRARSGRRAHRRTYRAYVEFAGSAQAHLRRTAAGCLGLGGIFGDGDAITPACSSWRSWPAVRSGADYLLAVSAQRAASERSLRFA